MVRKNRRIVDPAYEIIDLLRSRGYKAKIYAPDDSQNDPKVEEILELENILSKNPAKKSTK